MKTLRNILNRLGCMLACAALALSQAAPVTAYANDSVDKSETVHVQTDATGAVTSITVEEVLANTSGAATLEDSSTLTDIKADHPGEAELREYYKKSGLPLKRFFNTSGIPYRELGLSQKLPEMSEDEQFALLATDGMLVKRPLVVGEDFVLTGFKEAEWAEKLL